jgi:oligopeptide transport system substrate-binding protein
MVLVRNPIYRGLSRGNVERIEAPLIGEDAPLVELFGQGQLDGINLVNVDPDTVRQLSITYRHEYRLTPMLSTLYLSFRADRQPFDDERVRKAFIQAVDRKEVFRQTGAAHYTPALGGILPPGMPGHSPAIGLGVDHQAAQQWLSEAGFKRGQGFPQVELIYTEGSRANPLPAILQRLWREVLGIEVQALELAWGDFLERQKRDPPDIAINGWLADYPDPDSMLRLLFHEQEGLNRIHWSNTEFNELVEEAARITDRRRRLELYQAADRILVAEQAAVMPLSYAQGKQLLKPYVQLPRTPPSMLRLKHAVIQRDRG